ncbi:hypothetical protein HK096_005423 [Nowakowskiella sp. JEL0078]|nr:hypothetical protein HK096_005423 [Nowakowskiella sp. JEL0078]
MFEFAGGVNCCRLFSTLDNETEHENHQIHDGIHQIYDDFNPFEGDSDPIDEHHSNVYSDSDIESNDNFDEAIENDLEPDMEPNGLPIF